MKDIIKKALKIVNRHEYKICKKCYKNKKCNTYCLPVEMFVQIVEEKNNDEKIRMLGNIEYLFK